jgi:hypothetical protein
MTPNTPRSRLETVFQQIRDAHGSEIPLLKAKAQADIECTIEIIAALTQLSIGIVEMNRTATTMINDLIKSVDKARDQAEASSVESGKVASESANLSRKLNRLTFWIVIAAIVSAAAAGVQAWAAWYTITHNPHP